ncbi:hypothetical protein Adu01nite_09840 [Paractinoplanes durhamensis]|uniref:Ribosomal protein mS38 C-terminal domain-containing protein n=1 Tax=Paractinoplanes durhamensis TaxID=113563 RepID=A0ABQ3YQ23_9ACTN|nr:hypothetical protein Adu01nite_09840 [Actinoplanes durhamensis]
MGTLVRLVPAQAPAAVSRGEVMRDAVQSGRGRARWAPGFDPHGFERQIRMGSVVKKRRKRMAKKKHRKLLRKTRVQRRRLGK